MPFKPEEHRMVSSKSFSEYRVGDSYKAPSRTITEGIFAAFQAASGDNAPLHYDLEFCKSIGHGALYSHGFMTLIQSVIGATPLAHELGDDLIGFIEQSSKFLKPVYKGDTLYTEFTISELLPSDTTGVMCLSVFIYNHKSEMVLSGTQKYLIKL